VSRVVAVPFDLIVQNFWNQCEQHQDERATKIAMEAIKGAGLERVFEAVRKAEYEIEVALKESLSKVMTGINTND
jgi:hypothetical protein